MNLILDIPSHVEESCFIAFEFDLSALFSGRGCSSFIAHSLQKTKHTHDKMIR